MATWLMPVCRSWRLRRQRPAPPRTPPPTRAGSGGRPSCLSPRGGSTPVEIAQAGNRQLTGAVLAPGSRRRSQSRRSEGSSREPLSGDRARDRCRQSWFGRQASDPGKVTGPYRLAPGGPERPGAAVHADQGPDQGLRRVPSIRRDGQAEWRLNLRQKDTPVERPTPSGPPARVSSLSRRPPPAEPPSRRAFAGGTAAATGLSLSGGYLAPPRYPRPTSRPPD